MARTRGEMGMPQREREGSTAPTALAIILIATTAATLGGVVALRTSTIGVDLAAIAPGLGPALNDTLPAAVLMLAAAAVNLAAGAVVARALTGRPFDGPGSALLAGLTGAVLLDTAAMLALGSVGAFTRAALVVLIGGILAAGLLLHRRGQLAPFLEPSRDRGPEDWGRFPTIALWLLVAIVWGAPVVLQLASPVVPYGDVLPNHVAPVEHLRTFGSFATLTTSPSPIYGPSRIFLGYVATLGTLTTLTGLHAALAESAFILPLAVLVAVGARRVAAGLFGPAAGRWALLTFPLAFTFAQVPDARATVLVFPLAAFALEHMAAGSRAASGDAPSRAAPSLLIGAALGGAILVHPLLGVLTWLTAALVAAAAADHGRWAAPGLAAALIMGLAQAFTTLGLGLPSWVGLAPLAVGLVVLLRWRTTVAPLARELPSSLVRRPTSALPATVAAVAAGAIAAAPFVLPAATVTDWGLETGIGLLGLGTIAAAFLVPRAAGWPTVVAALAVGLLVMTAVNVLPGRSLLVESLQFEVPKTIRYWLPWFLAIASAGALAATWDRWGRRPAAWLVVTAALVAAALPLGRGPVTMIAVEERRFAESVSIQLHRAVLGYFVGYPDSRTLLDADQQEIIVALRSEQDAGRLTAGTTVLHIAASFQQWASTPIGVFTGALETTASANPEASIHTMGGRLFGLDAVPALLDEGFEYAVLEPADLPPGIRAMVVAAGFRPIFANVRGEVFYRG